MHVQRQPASTIAEKPEPWPPEKCSAAARNATVDIVAGGGPALESDSASGPAR